jgi:pericentriolar material 1 protein
MRECGEDLLVDMSEVLFNELAFFRLMQDLDDPLIAEKMKKADAISDSEGVKIEYIYSANSMCNMCVCL